MEPRNLGSAGENVLGEFTDMHAINRKKYQNIFGKGSSTIKRLLSKGLAVNSFTGQKR